MPDNLIPEIQLTDKFYVDQLGLLLKNSKTLPQQIRMYVKMLQKENDLSAELLQNLDILNIENPNSDLLTKVGKIVGGPREFLYDGKSYVMDDKQYLSYIYAHIIQNNWNGALKQANELYSELYKKNPYIDIKMMSSDTPLEVYLIMNAKKLPEGEEGQCYQAMFYSGYFDLTSMGVSFRKNVSNFLKAGYWDGIDQRIIDLVFKDEEEVEGVSKEQFIKNHNQWDIAYWN